MGRIKKACVIGGSGFIGSHIADELTSRGYEVYIFDKIKSKYLQDNQHMIIGNILDSIQVSRVLKDKDIVYNFAAKADIDDINPIETVKNNILGNTIILDACLKNKVKRFIFASSIYVYSDKGSFYRTSKQACESLIENYNEKYGLEYTILRYGSLYGPRANRYNWIYKIIKEALTKESITRHGTGEESRDYIYVKDASKLSVDILDKKYKNKNILITGNQNMKIKDLHMMINEMLGGYVRLHYLPENSKSPHYNITPYRFNPTPAEKLTSNLYYDMGQGILECIKEVYDEIQSSNF